MNKNYYKNLKTKEVTREQQLETTFKKITEQIQRYILAKVGVNLLAGIITTIVLAIIGVDFPIVWGLFVFLFNFIPTIGSAVALVFPVLFTLVQFDSFGTVILVLALMAGIQTLAFNVAEPMILGKRLKFKSTINSSFSFNVGLYLGNCGNASFCSANGNNKNNNLKFQFA